MQSKQKAMTEGRRSPTKRLEMQCKRETKESFMATTQKSNVPKQKRGLKSNSQHQTGYRELELIAITDMANA